MDDIFTEVPKSEVTIDPNKNYLEDLVGEGKKFKTPEELAKGKIHADTYISQLQKRLDDAERELKTRMTLEQFMDKMATPQSREQTEQPVIRPDTGNTSPDAQSIETLLEQALARREAVKAQETNQARVTRVLQEQFGPDATRAVNHTADNLGMSVKDLQALAMNNPAAFFRLMGVDESSARQTFTPQVPQTQVNQQFNQPARDASAHGRRFYDELKRKDPVKYASQETTVAMYKDMMRLGKEGFEAS